MFNMGARQMEKMMKQMGINSQPIDAVEVIIKGKEKDLVISNPQVTKITMQEQDTYQVIGEASERSVETFSEEDVKMIAEQTGSSEEEAKKALEETGDIAEVILKLKKE